MYTVYYMVNRQKFSKTVATKEQANLLKAELKDSGSYKNIKIEKK